MDRKSIIITTSDTREMTFEEVVIQFTPFIHKVINRWANLYEAEDLKQMCLLGMFKAYTTYDISKKYVFLSYADMIMSNIIRMYHRKQKKHLDVDSLDRAVMGTEELNLVDNLRDETNYEDEAIKSLCLSEVDNMLSVLSIRSKAILMDYYINNVNQKDLAKKYNISQAHISRVIKGSIEKVRRQII